MQSAAKRPFSFNYPCPRKLREIMKMSAIERETPETIEMIWNTYHQQRSHTCAKVINPSLYMQLLTNAQAAPIFVFPVPKGDQGGYFTLVC